MKNSKKYVQVFSYFIFCNLLLLLLVYRVHNEVVVLQIGSDTPNASVSIYYTKDNAFNETQRTNTVQVGEITTQIFTLDLNGILSCPNLRLDFNDIEATYYIKSINYVSNPFFNWTLEGNRLANCNNSIEKNSIISSDNNNGILELRTSDMDPFLVFNASTFTLQPNLLGILFVALLELLMLFTIRCAVNLIGKEDTFKPVPEQQKWLDLAKFISAYLVVTLHAEPLSGFNATLNYYLTQGVTRIAVPLFFAISGYLFFSRIYDPAIGRFQKNNAALQKHCIHSLILYFVWNVIYVFIYPDGLQFSSLISYFWYLLMGGGFWQLWYLLALSLGIPILYWILCSGISPRVVYSIGGILYLIGIILDFGYFKVIKSVVPLANTVGLFQVYFPRGGANAIFFAIPMLAIGVWFVVHTNHLRFVNKSKYLWIAAIVATLILMPAEALLAKDHFSDGPTNIWFTLPIAVFLLMSALLQKKECSLLSGSTARLMRSISTIIYLIHPFFIGCLRLIPTLKTNSIFLYLCVCIGSTLFSIILIKLSQSIPLLKKLY